MFGHQILANAGFCVPRKIAAASTVFTVGPSGRRSLLLNRIKPFGCSSLAKTIPTGQSEKDVAPTRTLRDAVAGRQAKFFWRCAQV
jgi:hypothetical protein